jgi:hypothetical protein
MNARGRNRKNTLRKLRKDGKNINIGRQILVRGILKVQLNKNTRGKQNLTQKCATN